MTRYDLITSELPAQKRKALINAGVLPSTLERNLGIYAEWLNLGQERKKMDAYALIATHFQTSEYVVMTAIKELGQSI